MVGFGLPELLIIIVIILFVLVPAYFIAKILDKAGFSRWYSLLSLVPIANIVCLWIFAFIDWPAETN